MNLFVTKRAEADRRLEFKEQPRRGLELLCFLLGVAAGTFFIWAWFYDGT